MASDRPETGFLTADDPRVFEADLYIAAMGRSGSTYLANLLTNPPHSWVMVEPWFVNGAFNASVKRGAAELGWPLDDRYWRLPTQGKTHDAFLERYRNFLAPRLRTLTRWGVKEVRPEFHEPTIATINPKRIIILVRNMRDVASSLLEKQLRQGTLAERGYQWTAEYCRSSAESLMRLHDRLPAERIRVVRYEDLTAHPDKRSELEEWLDWPMAGNPSTFLVELGRGYEIERHANPGAAVERQLPEGAGAVIKRICAENASYGRHFGYPSGA